jgi:hypothetical protein
LLKESVKWVGCALCCGADSEQIAPFYFGFVELILMGVDGVDGVGEKEPGEGKPRHYISLEILVVPEMWWLVIMHFPLQLKADLGWSGLAS